MPNKLYTHENLAQFIEEHAKIAQTQDESEMIYVSRAVISHIKNHTMTDGNLIHEIHRQLAHYSIDYTATDATRVLKILKEHILQTPA